MSVCLSLCLSLIFRWEQLEYPIFYTVVMSIVGRLASIVWDLMAAVILDAVKGKSNAAAITFVAVETNRVRFGSIELS